MAADPGSDAAFRGLSHLRSVAQASANQIAQTSAEQAPAAQPATRGLTPQERLAFNPPRPSSEIHIVDHTEPVDSTKSLARGLRACHLTTAACGLISNVGPQRAVRLVNGIGKEHRVRSTCLPLFGVGLIC